jgi:TPR repeat protein
MWGQVEVTRRIKSGTIMLLLVAAGGWCPELAAQVIPAEAAVARQFSRAFAGDISVQRQLGIALERGAGVEQNYTQAAYWLGKAAGLGDPLAQTELGILYLEGTGVPKDAAKAVEWFQLAALSNFPLAEHNLGTMYYQGSGVRRDVDEALRWFRKAAERGLPQSELNVGVLALSGVGGGDADAIRWLRKAAKHQYPMAWFALGYAYEQGRGVSPNFSEAAKYYAKAGDEKVAAANTNLGLLYESGQGVARDLRLAKQRFMRGAEGGDPFAYVSLARIAMPDSRELPEVYFWLRAAELSLPAAQPLLHAVQANAEALRAKLPSEAQAAAEERAADWVAAHPRIATAPLTVDIARN